MLERLGVSGAGAALAPDPLARLLPIMDARGVALPPRAFHSAVKMAFFSSGAALYDEVSASLWQSLGEQLQRLASDNLCQYPRMSNKMTVHGEG